MTTKRNPINFGTDEFRDPIFEKKTPQVNPMYFEENATRKDSVDCQFQDFVGERKNVLHDLWDEIGIDWKYRENFIDRNFSFSQNQRYNFIADETLRLYGFIKTDNVIKGLILHREKVLERFSKLQGGGTIKTLDIHRRKFVLSLIQVYRTYTLYIIEHLEDWEKKKGDEYEWNSSGENVIAKMATDFTRICNKNHCLSLVMDFYDYSKTPFALPNNRNWYLQNTTLLEEEEDREQTFFLTQPKGKKKKKKEMKEYQPLKNIIKLPPLLLYLKYHDIKKKLKQYSHLLINLRVKDLLGQQNQVRLEKKREQSRNAAIRATRKVVHQLKAKRNLGETVDEFARRRKKMKLTSKKKLSASLYRRRAKAKKKAELLKRTKFLPPNISKEFLRLSKADFYVRNYLATHSMSYTKGK